MMLRKGLEVQLDDEVKNEEKNTNATGKEEAGRKEGKEEKKKGEDGMDEDPEDEEGWRAWKGIEEEGSTLVARVEDVGEKKRATLGNYIAQLFEERLKMEMILSNDPSAIHYLQEAMRLLL